MDEKIEKQKSKFIALYEVAKKSLLTCKFLRQRLLTTLSSYENLIDNKIQLDEKVTSAFTDASAFVDYANRFHDVVGAIPLISKKSSELTRLNNHMQIVTDVRNYLQHMRGDLSKADIIDFDILGSISWTNEKICYNISLTQTFTADVSCIPFDRELNWIRNSQYEIDKKIIDFDFLINEMTIAFTFISQKASEINPNIAKLEWGQTVSFKTVIQRA